MSHKRRAEDELQKLKRELRTIRAYLGAADADAALTRLGRAEGYLKRAADEVHRVEEA